MAEEKPIGIESLPPLVLSPKQEELCDRLDKLHAKFNLKALPSKMFRGAIFAAQVGVKENPDWISQAANSLRDIMYPFGNYGIPNKEEALKVFGSVRLAEVNSVGRILGKLTELAHHGNAKGSSVNYTEFTPEDFEKLLTEFEDVMFNVLARQVNVHQEVDELLREDPPAESKKVKELIELNLDTRQYFYSKADESWLLWLWQNGFLSGITKAEPDPTQSVYRMPELNYLVKMAEKSPREVTDVMLEIPISEGKLNPDTLDQLLWICSQLPPEDLKRIIPKIQRENWILLIRSYSHYGFKFEKMFKALSSVGDSESMLILSQILLQVRKKGKEKADGPGWADNPFYFNDLEGTGIFDFLESVEEGKLETALSLVSSTMGKVVIFNQEKRDPQEPFAIGDGFAFYDVDFFGLETGEKKHKSFREDIRDLASTLKALIQRALDKCQNPERARDTFNNQILSLPDSQAMWRFRLFVMSICPKVFEKEIKEALFRISEVERPHNLTMGSEYETLLGKSLHLFSDEERSKYKEAVFNSFREKEKETLSKADVHGIGSTISSWLTPDEREKVKDYTGLALDENYKPQPVISSSKGGYIKSTSDVTDADLSELTISQIAEKLKTDWDPSHLTLEKQEESGDITTYDAEGLATVIKGNMHKRLEEYLQNAPLFFDRTNLSAHYTYAFLRGIFDVIQKKEAVFPENWDGLFELFNKLKVSFEEDPRDISGKDAGRSFTWLAGWGAVHSAAADVIKALVNLKKDNQYVISNSYRDKILLVLCYLLHHPNPSVQSETCEPAERNGEVKYNCSDPYTHAINSVRGKAFEALIGFIHRDSERFEEGVSSKIEKDVKDLYLALFNREDTRSMMFLFGHHYPTISVKDKEMAKNLISVLFDFQEPRLDLSLAAWEGYITNSLYANPFRELEFVYSKAIDIKRAQYTPREYFGDLDDVLATHLALAYMHFPDITLQSALLKKFFEEKSIKRHTEFISFLGRYIVSRNDAKKWMRENSIQDAKKLEEFWDWILDQNLDPKVYEAFGFWADAEWGVFDLVWQAEHVKRTLEKTNGAIEWDHNLQDSLVVYAQASPKNTLEIARLYFLNYLALRAENQGWIHTDEKIIEAFRLLHQNPETKEETEELINALLPHGNGVFWKLKDILKK